MSLPVYFVSQGHMAPPCGKTALCGWHCGPDGTLRTPELPSTADALVFDDRHPLPEAPDGLIGPLLHSAAALGAEVIVLDFERPPSPAARGFAQTLAGRFRTVAPAQLEAEGCEPIFCYSPSVQTFPAFLAGAWGWIELRPVHETVRYRLASDVSSCEGESFFSDLLQCRCRARQEADMLMLELFDTPQTFLARVRQLSGRFSAAVGLRSELEAFGLPGAPATGTSPAICKWPDCSEAR